MRLFQHIITMVCIGASFIGRADRQPTARAEGAADQPIAVELQRLQGTWEGVMVGQEKDGNITITITSNSLHFHRDTNFWFETTFTLPVGTGPKQLHATIKDCAGKDSIGKVVVAIYKIEDGTLTLVAIGDETPKSFEAPKLKGSVATNSGRFSLKGKILNNPKPNEPKTPNKPDGANRRQPLGFREFAAESGALALMAAGAHPHRSPQE
jgi:uncharacterized protein (TIGR03067 family)